MARLFEEIKILFQKGDPFPEKFKNPEDIPATRDGDKIQNLL